MSEEKVLSNEEMDALLTGVSSGEVETGGGVRAPGEVVPFDIGALDRVSGGFPRALATVYGRLAEGLAERLAGIVRQSVSVTVETLRVQRYADYVGGLPSPVSLHLFAAQPLRGQGLFALDTPLLFSFVDLYFGGAGALPESMDRDALTPAELRMAGVLLNLVSADLGEAWTDIANLSIELGGIETEPSRAPIAAPTEPVVTAVFGVEMKDACGELHIVMPQVMLGPVRSLLDASDHGDLDERDRFVTAVRSGLKDTRVEVVAALTETPINVGALLKLKPGDVIPVDLPETITVKAGETPVLLGTFGVSRGQNAVKVLERMPVTEPTN